MTAPARTPEEWYRRATFDVESYDLETLYYEGGVRMTSMGWALPPGMEVLQTIVNWCALGVNALSDRLTPGGFRVRGESKPSKELSDLWVDAGMPAESRLAILEAIVHRRGYLTVSAHPTDPSRGVIRAESRRNIWTECDPATGDVLSAVRWIPPAPDDANSSEALTVYEPNVTSTYRRQLAGAWSLIAEPIRHNLGTPTVVPLVHGATVWNRQGYSRMRDVAGLTDACCRTLTNLGGAQELMGAPARYVFGAKESDFKDKEGNTVPKWQVYLGRMLMLGDKDAKAGQFAAADLRNFVEVINVYAKLVSSMTGLPPDYLGYSDANPASAEGIYASRERLVTSATSECVSMGDAFERAMRLLSRIVNDSDPGSLECLWDDPATPTLASKADAGVKLFTAGILPREGVWDILGLNPDVQERYAALMAAERDSDPTERTSALLTAAGATAKQLPGNPDPEPGPAAR